MTRSFSKACDWAAISATVWRSLRACRRPIGSSIVPRKHWHRATRSAWLPRRRRSPHRRPGRKRHSIEARSMLVCANLPMAVRDVRLDLFRGLANWAIFLDHIPHEVLSSLTTKNYGFSDAAEVFVFVSGYTAASVFGKTMIER